MHYTQSRIFPVGEEDPALRDDPRLTLFTPRSQGEARAAQLRTDAASLAMLPLGGGVAPALFHSRPTPSPSTCKAAFEHDTTATVLSSLIIAGLLLSYAPQYIRIIRHKNSEGFSPLFLLLGATSSASSLGNIVTLQWGQVACCQYLVRHRGSFEPEAAICLADHALPLFRSRFRPPHMDLHAHASSYSSSYTLQSPQSKGQCAESVLGIAQVFTQWFCFSLMCVRTLLPLPMRS